MSPICTITRFGLVIRTNLGPLMVPTLTRWKLIGLRENPIGASVVGVELGVAVPVDVGVALAVGTRVGSNVRVGVGSRVATEVGVGLEVGVDVSAGVEVGDGDKFAAIMRRATNDVTFAACAMPPPFTG